MCWGSDPQALVDGCLSLHVSRGHRDIGRVTLQRVADVQQLEPEESSEIKLIFLTECEPDFDFVIFSAS